MRITPDETLDLPEPLMYKHFLSQKDLKVPKKAKSEATWKVLSDFVIQLRITTVRPAQLFFQYFFNFIFVILSFVLFRILYHRLTKHY